MAKSDILSTAELGARISLRHDISAPGQPYPPGKYANLVAGDMRFEQHLQRLARAGGITPRWEPSLSLKDRQNVVRWVRTMTGSHA